MSTQVDLKAFLKGRFPLALVQSEKLAHDGLWVDIYQGHLHISIERTRTKEFKVSDMRSQNLVTHTCPTEASAAEKVAELMGGQDKKPA